MHVCLGACVCPARMDVTPPSRRCPEMLEPSAHGGRWEGVGSGSGSAPAQPDDGGAGFWHLAKGGERKGFGLAVGAERRWLFQNLDIPSHPVSFLGKVVFLISPLIILAFFAILAAGRQHMFFCIARVVVVFESHLSSPQS